MSERRCEKFKLTFKASLPGVGVQEFSIPSATPFKQAHASIMATLHAEIKISVEAEDHDPFVIYEGTLENLCRSDIDQMFRDLGMFLQAFNPTPELPN